MALNASITIAIVNPSGVWLADQRRAAHTTPAISMSGLSLIVACTPDSANVSAVTDVITRVREEQLHLMSCAIVRPTYSVRESTYTLKRAIGENRVAEQRVNSDVDFLPVQSRVIKNIAFSEKVY